MRWRVDGHLHAGCGRSGEMGGLGRGPGLRLQQPQGRQGQAGPGLGTPGRAEKVLTLCSQHRRKGAPGPPSFHLRGLGALTGGGIWNRQVTTNVSRQLPKEMN